VTGGPGTRVVTDPGRRVENRDMRTHRASLAAGLAVLLLGSAGCVSKSKYEESQQQNEKLK